jgi:uncharacterized membrane protein YeaQ/YmgE (transglycosylase-associated protein family)
MLKILGLSHLSSNEVMLILLICICISLLVGWLFDMIMQRLGFGLFGNAFICMLGIFVGVAAYQQFYGRMTSPDITMVSAFAVGSVMVHLVALSILRRVFRIN